MKIPALLLTLAMLGSVHASTCVPRKPLLEEISASDQVLVVQVRTVALTATKAMIEATVDVEEVLKGAASPAPVVRAHFNDYNYKTDGAPITYRNADMSPGMRLLVFAASGKPVIYDAGCTATTRLERHDAASLTAVRAALRSR